jgi:hypothetical protein
MSQNQKVLKYTLPTLMISPVGIELATKLQVSLLKWANHYPNPGEGPIKT